MPAPFLRPAQKTRTRPPPAPGTGEYCFDAGRRIRDCGSRVAPARVGALPFYGCQMMPGAGGGP